MPKGPTGCATGNATPAPVVRPDPGTARLFWQTTDGVSARLYLGHVLDALAVLPEKSVHTCITSPPYWGLRDYGTGTWEGGDPGCDHRESSPERTAKSKASSTLGGSTETVHASHVFKELCLRCGATRRDLQLGSEPSPDCKTDGQAQCGRCFVCAMVSVFRGVRRVLRDDGTLWLNLGDSYAASPRGNKQPGGGNLTNSNIAGKGYEQSRFDGGKAMDKLEATGLKSGNLVGVPWRVALALQADGWVLRSDIPWVKRSAMPESVTSRPAKALEYVFLLAKKGSGYFYDNEAVKVRGKSGWASQSFAPESAKDAASESKKHAASSASRANRSPDVVPEGTGRNFRNADLWFESVDKPHGLTGVGDELVGLDVTSGGYPGAHFATFSENLVVPMIKAGTSARGCCGDCGAPWERVTDRTGAVYKDGAEDGRDRSFRDSRNGIGGTLDGVVPDVKTVGWRPTCECAHVEIGEYGDTEHHVPAPVVPCTVLDPFLGSGTTVAEALRLGRRGVGIDLSEKYLRDNAIPRVSGPLLESPATAHLVPRKSFLGAIKKKD